MDKKLFKSLIKSIKQMNKIRRNKCRFWHILKLRIRWWLNYGWTFKISIGKPLTSDERGELARWITRNVTTSTEETLREVWREEGDEDFG